MQIPKTEEEDAKQFKIIGDPNVHITNVINHHTMCVEGNKLEELRPQVLYMEHNPL